MLIVRLRPSRSAPPDAAAALDVTHQDNVGGHVVHHESEERDPKKENGALDKGASGENYLQETTDGRLVAVINTDILDGIDMRTWDRATEEAVKKAASQELKKFEQGIAVNGLTVTTDNGTTLIDGGKISAESIKANQIDIRKQSKKCSHSYAN